MIRSTNKVLFYPNTNKKPFDRAPQEYSVQLTFREQWTDERLKFDDIQGE